MGLGFIHGVMNTDNMSIAGETIDYGPCAFLDGYHPETVFSSIDRWGRYAYAQQPQVAVWNLAQFATCLLPMMADRETAIDRFTTAVNDFGARYQREWLSVFRAKLGLATEEEDDSGLIERLLDIMAANRDDFTRVFRGLGDDTASDHVTDRPAFDQWHQMWTARLTRDGTSEADRHDRMTRANPAVIPRNHHVEAVIAAAVAGDMDLFHAMHRATTDPFTPHDLFGQSPAPGEEVQATFCGT